MVMAPRASAPARLTQQQVDDLREGRGADAADAAVKALHAVRRPAAAKAARAPAGSAPLPLTPEDLQAIADQGAAPERLSSLIAALARPAAPKASAAGSAPGLKRPSESGGA